MASAHSSYSRGWGGPMGGGSSLSLGVPRGRTSRSTSACSLGNVPGLGGSREEVESSSCLRLGCTHVYSGRPALRPCVHYSDCQSANRQMEDQCCDSGFDSAATVPPGTSPGSQSLPQRGLNWPIGRRDAAIPVSLGRSLEQIWG